MIGLLMSFILFSHVVLTSTSVFKKQSFPSHRFDFVKRSEECGYSVEVHRVVTEDGYVLKLFRLASDTIIFSTYKPVLLQHGLLTDSNFWILNGCERSLPYLLHRSGLDVWVANSRGTLYSNRHVTLSVFSDEYWNFSFDEMAEYDTPSFLEYVLNVTNQKKLNFVGHSQGTEILFAAPTQRPEVVDMIDKFIALAPVARVDRIKGLFKFMTWLFPNENLIRFVFGNGEFDPPSSTLSSISKFTCSILPIEICSIPLFMINGFNPKEFDKSIMNDVLSSCPSSTSTKNIIHYFQENKRSNFQFYDYGKQGNIQYYGEDTPPLYDLGKCVFPVHIIVGTSDWLSPMANVKWLETKLPNVSSTMYLDGWTHLDVVFAKYAPTKVFTEIIRIVSDN